MGLYNKKNIYIIKYIFIHYFYLFLSFFILSYNFFYYNKCLNVNKICCVRINKKFAKVVNYMII